MHLTQLCANKIQYKQHLDILPSPPFFHVFTVDDMMLLLRSTGSYKDLLRNKRTYFQYMFNKVHNKKQ